VVFVAATGVLGLTVVQVRGPDDAAATGTDADAAVDGAAYGTLSPLSLSF
jgi:hypothetical protein